VGPFTGPQLAQAIGAGRVSRDTLVWSAGMSQWARAETVEAIAGYFAPAPPPVPGG
jgi:hypothetical protein